MKIPRFFLFFSLIALGLFILGYFLNTYWVPQTSRMAIFTAILVSFITGGLAYVLTYTGLEKGNQRFITGLIVGMISKMFVGVIILLIVIVQYRPVVKEYVVSYLLAYFIFTAFEVYGLMRKLRA